MQPVWALNQLHDCRRVRTANYANHRSQPCFTRIPRNTQQIGITKAIVGYTPPADEGDLNDLRPPFGR